jgi:hypothetical protein
MRTRLASEPAPILLITLARRAFTVRSVVPNSVPACLFSRPVVINGEDFSLTGSRSAPELHEFGPLELFRAPRARKMGPPSYRAQESLIVNRLFEEIHLRPFSSRALPVTDHRDR